MKKIYLLMAVVVLLAAVSAQAEVLLFEDWETGMDGWVPYGVEPYATLSPDANTTSGGMWSLKTPDNVMTNYAGAVDWNFVSETSANWYVKFNFYDTGSTREYLQIQSYSPDATFQNLYALGAYHSVTNGMMYYASRIAAGSTNWQPTPVLRTTGWHSI